MHALVRRPKFVNAVAQIIGHRAPHFMPELPQPPQICETLVVNFNRQLVQPSHYWRPPIVVPVQSYVRPRHIVSMLSFLLSVFQVWGTVENAPWGGQSWPQPPFRRPEPAKGRLRAE
jgi:hypothetical protein